MPRHKPEMAPDDDRPEPAVRYRGDRPTIWSPPVPAFQEEPWRRLPGEFPADLQAELAALKAKLAVPEGGGTALDPEQARRYLAACAKARGGPAPPTEPAWITEDA